VRSADAADGTSLASVTGFYGTAIGPSGGGTLAWAGSGAPGSGNDNGADDQANPNDSGPVTNPAPTPAPPPAQPAPTPPADEDE
jgi:hypothetical protein